MGWQTYSFEDVVATFQHPKIGQYIAHGSGIGSITTTMTQDKTTHDVAADGNIMVSRVLGRNGSHAFAIQQTSDLNRWFLKAYKYLDTVAPASEWAQMTITIRSTVMGEQTHSIGCSFQKLPDKPYQAQGQQVTWNILAAGITQDVI